MTTTEPEVPPLVSRAYSPPRREVIGAWLLLVGFTSLYLGIAWDVQWHLDIGPDTFFTVPHLLLYFGGALIGTTSLVVVLANTRREQRSSSTGGGPAVTVFRIFRAPVAFLVSGLGASAQLLFGAADLWWHDFYGFDGTESTPSHLGVTLGLSVEAVGLLMAFAALRGRRSGRWGFAIAGALWVVGLLNQEDTPVTEGVLLGIDKGLLYNGAVCAVLLGIVIGVTRSPRWVMATGLVFAIIQGFLAVFTPLATQIYANAIDMPFRDDAPKLPLTALGLPTVFPVMTVLAAGLLVLARRRDIRPRTAMAVMGAATGVAVAAYSIALSWSDGWDANPFVSIPAVALCGAAVGWFGWQSAALLRTLTPREAA